MPEELWMEVHHILQKAVIKTILKKKKYKEAKWLSKEPFPIAEKSEIRKGEVYVFECSVPKNSKER